MRNAYPADLPASPPLYGRALVLGGGGSTGNAWMIGVLAGLQRAGVDVTDADLLIGTSAGATTAAQISFRSPAELFAAMPAAPPRGSDAAEPGQAADRPGSNPRGTTGSGEVGGAVPRPGGGSARPGGVAAAVAAQLDRTAAIIAASFDATDMRERMASAARELEGAGDESRHARWRATVASRLPEQRWPDRALRITAVDAADGAPFVFDRDSGVALADAIAASCASGAPHRIADRWFIDGGYLRNENSDLAIGCDRVLVLSPFGGRTRHPLEWRMQLSAQVEDLRAAGSRVETVGPEESATRVIGANAMDPSLRPVAARAGFEQGVSLADRIARFWK